MTLESDEAIADLKRNIETIDILWNLSKNPILNEKSRKVIGAQIYGAVCEHTEVCFKLLSDPILKINTKDKVEPEKKILNKNLDESEEEIDTAPRKIGKPRVSATPKTGDKLVK